MSFFATLAIVLQSTTAAFGQAAPSAEKPHPAVVRVIAPESDGIAYGSGALVATSGQHGLVVTNWHVVRDASGQIKVAFPDGFRSAATVLATDPDWDLAALAIWRPGVEPVRLASVAPRPGDPLTIAGYGSGRYRAMTGRCTQYVAPGMNHPFEMVELSVAARQGDSGGPIFNQQGELAGVLFGSGQGTTAGSYCGRVRWFLAKVTDQFRQSADASIMIADRPLPERPSISPQRVPDPPRHPAEPSGYASRPPRRAAPNSQPPETRPPIAAIAAPAPPHDGLPEREASPDVANGGWTPSAPPDDHPAAEEVPVEASPDVPAGPTRLDQIKTILAAIGALAILLHGLRLLGAVDRS